MAAVYHWLVHNGLYPSIVGTLVLLALTQLLAWRHIRNAYREVRNAYREFSTELARIRDLLDANTPGGTADIVAALEELKPEPPSS